MQSPVLRAGAVLISAMALLSSASLSFAQTSVIFQDDFSDEGSGWSRYSKTADPNTSVGAQSALGALDYLADYAAASYFIYDNVPGDIRSVTNSQLVQKGAADASVEVDVGKGSGPDSGGYGLTCRTRPAPTGDDPQSFYALLVTADGSAGLGKVVNNQYSDIVAPSATSAVATGEGINHLKLTCVGTRITGYVNDQMIGAADDSDLTDGAPGMWARAAAQPPRPGSGAIFNKFVVTQPGS